MTSIVAAIRDGALDAELAALLWLLAGGGVPVHVATKLPADAVPLLRSLEPLAAGPDQLSSGPGERLEAVLALPVPLRPASGVVLIVSDGRVAAAHFQRPPLRDAGGHVRPQGPAVLATWDEALGGWEHFAWGIIPELADATRRRAGDFEIEQRRRREYLEALVSAGIADGAEVERALAGYGARVTRDS